MRFFRTAPTGRLLAFIGAVLAMTIAATVGVAVARGGNGSTPPPRELAQAIHDALAAPHPQGITARIHFTNNLLPSGALTGQAGSPLLTGADGRLWLNADGGRLELQSDAGDAQITWTDSKVTIYDASTNTAYVAALPAQKSATRHTPPTLDDVTKALAHAASWWLISGATPSNVAGEEAYSVLVSPKGDGGLLGSVEIAWDAGNGTPLRLAVTARGSTAPALELAVTSIAFGSVPASDTQISPPAGAKIVELPAHAGGSAPAPVTGLAAVQAAAPFPIVAPDTLGGLARQQVRLVGPADSRSVLVVYGTGLGAILVVERQAAASSQGNGMLGALPTVALDGVTGQELATPLGTVVRWDRNGVSFVLAGSVPAAAAESAARELR